MTKGRGGRPWPQRQILFENWISPKFEFVYAISLQRYELKSRNLDQKCTLEFLIIDVIYLVLQFRFILILKHILFIPAQCFIREPVT